MLLQGRRVSERKAGVDIFAKIFQTKAKILGMLISVLRKVIRTVW